MKNQSGFGVVVVIILVLVMAALVVGAYYLGTQRNYLQTASNTNPISTLPTTTISNPSPLSPTSIESLNSLPSPTTDPTSDWKTYNFSNTVSLKLPTKVNSPKYVNAGHYAVETILPGNTTLQLWGADGASPTGGTDNYDNLKQSLIHDQAIQTQSYSLQNRETIKFTSNAASSNLIWGGNIHLKMTGVLVKMNDGRGLMIIHYQNQTSQNRSNFSQDEALFSQILSTFQFIS